MATFSTLAGGKALGGYYSFIEDFKRDGASANELRDAAFRSGAAAARIHDDVREWERPSDHAPVSADLAL